MTTKFIEDLMQRFAVLAEQEPESNILLRTLASADPVVREEFFSYLKKASENSLAPASAAAGDAPPRHWSDDLATEPPALPPIAPGSRNLAKAIQLRRRGGLPMGAVSGLCLDQPLGTVAPWARSETFWSD